MSGTVTILQPLCTFSHFSKDDKNQFWTYLRKTGSKLQVSEWVFAMASVCYWVERVIALYRLQTLIQKFKKLILISENVNSFIPLCAANFKISRTPFPLCWSDVAAWPVSDTICSYSGKNQTEKICAIFKAENAPHLFELCSRAGEHHRGFIMSGRYCAYLVSAGYRLASVWGCRLLQTLLFDLSQESCLICLAWCISGRPASHRTSPPFSNNVDHMLSVERHWRLCSKGRIAVKRPK